jgi:hypothetical protein
MLDLSLPPLDGWYVLAALGHIPLADRPRVVAMVAARPDIERARMLGADLCVAAGTAVHARALSSPNKERPWRRSPASSCPRPTTSGAPD